MALCEYGHPSRPERICNLRGCALAFLSDRDTKALAETSLTVVMDQA